MEFFFKALLIGLIGAASTSVPIPNAAHAGPLLHVHDEYGMLATVNAATGAVSKIGSMGVVMTDIAFDSSNRLFGISFDSLYQIDPRTAAATFIGNHHIPQGNALTFAPDGTLYAAGAATTSLYRINTKSGQASAERNIGYTSAGDLAFAANWRVGSSSILPGGCYPAVDSLLMTSTGGDLIGIADAVIHIYPPVPHGRIIGDLGVNDMYGLAAGPDNRLYGVAGNHIYVVDPTTGSSRWTASMDGQGMGRIYGASCRPIPEPASSFLIVLGGALTLLLNRSCRQRERPQEADKAIDAGGECSHCQITGGEF